MPTYRNDSTTKSFQIKNYSGETVIVKPGHSIQTEDAFSMTDLTLTAATPYYNPCVAREDVTIVGAGDYTIAMHSLADSVEIVNGTSATLTVYMGAKTNLPAVKVTMNQIKTIENIKGKYSSMILTISEAVTGGLYVHQYK